MSIWLLLVYAVCMLATVLGFGGHPPYAHVAVPVCLVTLLIFVTGLLLRGVRRPVV